MFLLVLLTMLLRRRIVAVAAFMAVVYTFFLLLFEHRTPSGLVYAVFPSIFATVFVTRFGLLTTVAFPRLPVLQEYFPTTLELSTWFAPATMVSLAEEAAQDPRAKEIAKIKSEVEELSKKEELTDAEQARMEKLSEREEISRTS